MSEHSNLQNNGRAVHLINLSLAEEDVATILALLAYTKHPMSITEIAEANVIPLPSAKRYLSQLMGDEKIKMVFGDHTAGYTLV
jgi:DNA-binding IscR family transcriptional regulator